MTQRSRGNRPQNSNASALSTIAVCATVITVAVVISNLFDRMDNRAIENMMTNFSWLGAICVVVVSTIIGLGLLAYIIVSMRARTEAIYGSPKPRRQRRQQRQQPALPAVQAPMVVYPHQVAGNYSQPAGHQQQQPQPQSRFSMEQTEDWT